jgi:hypothetical protein
MDKGKRHEFRAVIDGMDLSDEMVERLDRAVQSAITAELAQLNLGTSAIARTPLQNILKNLGRTRGIWIGEINREQLEKIGFGG